MGNKSTDKSEKTEKTEAFTVKKLADWISIKKIAVAVGFAFFASMVPNWLLAFIARPSGDDYGYSAASHQTWLHTHSVIEVLRTLASMGLVGSPATNLSKCGRIVPKTRKERLMTFQSYLFLFAFFPVLFIIYYVLLKKKKIKLADIFLAAMSFVF